VLARGGDGRLAVLFNRSGHEVTFHLPARDGHRWEAENGSVHVGPRAVVFVAEILAPSSSRTRQRRRGAS
jgi:hypothetical protein